MKNILFLSIILTFILDVEVAGQKIWLASKLAQNHTSVNFFNPPANENAEFRKKVAAWGVQGGYRVNKFFGLTSEIFFEERGWYFPHIALLPDGTLVDIGLVDVYYSFITVPILIEVGVGKKIRPFLFGGFNPAFRVDGKYKTSFNNGS